jgi:hypothetical protein
MSSCPPIRGLRQWHEPSKLKRSAMTICGSMTIDHLSAGRLTLGIGAGGTGFDATVMG